MLTDAELVASARSGDRGALSEIYDSYADRLYDLCTSVLRDPEAAFDAMVDTFVLAALELYRLRRPEKLEPWLFALARQQLLGRDIQVGVDEHAEFDGATGKAASDGAGAIVWEAVSWFPGKDRVLLDLHARQPLDNQALADTLGVSPPHAAALVRDLDEKTERQLSALLVARLASPGCEHMKKLIAGEDEAHPDKWLRQVAAHVDTCRKCSFWREDQPKPMQLIGEVPAEPAPPEVRDEVLDRVDLLWSVLGPPEWTAAVLGQTPPEVATDTSATSDATPAASDMAVAAPESSEPTEPVEIAAPVETAAPVEGSQGEVTEREYDAYEEVESLVPPPPRLRRSGFPRSMYPGRRLVVRAAVIALAAVFVAAIVTDFRGFGRDTRSFAAEAKAAARQKPPVTTTPTTTAPPVTTVAPGPDTRPPFVYNLATVFGCIGPRQTTTPALASVVDPGDHLAEVELVYVDTASGGETRKRMTASGGAFEAPIGPYAADGTITWRVEASDEAGNRSTGEGQAVGASAAC
ncbi:MAG TPA: sigma-70 family RNA polymerase sigma factor [Acidimicrobiia bacterium]|nr:sigma-70 family RNA polymerase sigma factor [Acidimicrobiia bacterium]